MIAFGPIMRTAVCWCLPPRWPSIFATNLRARVLCSPPRIVTTFGKFVEDYCAEEEPVTSTALALIVEEQLQRLDLPRYSGVRQFPGFRAALARTIDEFSGAGGTAMYPLRLTLILNRSGQPS